MTKILILSASPRRNGNSDTLCQRFAEGARDDGKDVEYIFLADKKIGYCRGCNYCQKKGRCVQEDDFAPILDSILAADVIVFGSPIYFYCINAQLKTVIDRCYPRYQEIKNKVFYFLLTAADNAPDTFDEAMTALGGFVRCLENCEVARVIKGIGVFRPHEIKENLAYEMAYVAGGEC